MNNYKQNIRSFKVGTDHFYWLPLLLSLTLFLACDNQPDHIDWDCGDVDTEIVALDERVGSYFDGSWSSSNSTDFEMAAINLGVDDSVITTETETSCFSFNPFPQRIEEFKITSSQSVTSDAVEYSQGENLAILFKIDSDNLVYTITDFITAHQQDPLLFFEDGDEVYLQLLNKSDVTINQSFAIQITFDDGKTLGVEIPLFEVSE